MIQKVILANFLVLRGRIMEFKKKSKLIASAIFLVLLIAIALGLVFLRKQSDEKNESKAPSESSSDFAELLESEELDEEKNVVEQYEEEKNVTALPKKGSSDSTNKKEESGKAVVESGNTSDKDDTGDAGSDDNQDNGGTGDDSDDDDVEDNQPETSLKPSEDTEGDGYGPVTFY